VENPLITLIQRSGGSGTAEIIWHTLTNGLTGERFGMIMLLEIRNEEKDKVTYKKS
jgi:hypothetical protein